MVRSIEIGRNVITDSSSRKKKQREWAWWKKNEGRRWKYFLCRWVFKDLWVYWWRDQSGFGQSDMQ